MRDHDSLRLVSYCGLFCGLCAQRSRIPRQALQLSETLHEEGFNDFYQYEPEMKNVFPVFWSFLQRLAALDCSCRTGKGGPPNCKTRDCAKEKKVLVCPQCTDYPCEHIRDFAEHYPVLLQDGKRLQRIGLKKWIKDQEERAKKGFTYADIRYRSSSDR